MDLLKCFFYLWVLIFGPTQQKDLLILYLNINSLLPIINELKSIANKIKATIIGIAELKINYTVPDLDVNLPGYDIPRCDRSKNGGGVSCYIRKDFKF